MEYGGVDHHKKFSYLTIKDEQGREWLRREVASSIVIVNC